MQVYCIEHEKMVEAFPLVACDGLGHEYEEAVEYEDVIVMEKGTCCMRDRWSLVPPPALMMTGREVARPTIEDIQRMDAQAQELLSTWSEV